MQSVDFRPYVESVAKVLYGVYFTEAGGVSAVTGQTLPDWEKCPERVRQCWIAVADVVVSETSFIPFIRPLKKPHVPPESDLVD